MTEPYEAYAAIYDRTGQSRFGTRLARITLDWLKAHGMEIESVLDLATGTGAAALVFAGTGLPTTGIDRSAAMLEQAAANAAVAGLRITFDQQDMRSFAIPDAVTLVTAYFDSVNYLVDDDDVRATFNSVFRALLPGGWFVFDLNTVARYDRAWNDSVDLAFEDADTFVIFRSSFDPSTARSPLTLTAFERTGDAWHRWDETHIERGYRLAEIETWLREAGFEPVSVAQLNERTLALEGPATERSDRAVFFARKRSDSPEQRA